MLISFISFGLLGMIAEVAFVAVKHLLAERSFELKGTTSLWMFPIYGLIAVIYPVVAVHISELAWYFRGLIYAGAIFIVEYLTGWVLTKMRVRPWHYPEKWSVGGLIYLPYAPVWFLAGLGIEWIWPKVQAISYAIG